jgi:hypothetical protein
VTAEAERYLRRLAEAELRREEPVDRLRAAADALVWAGAVDQTTAEAVVTGFVTARDLRGGRRPIQAARPLSAIRPTLTGAVRVVPVGATLPGRYQPLHLLALTLAPGQAAVLTLAGLINADARPGRDDLPTGPYGPSGPDLELTITGDHGTRYQGEMSGGGTSDAVWWRQDLVLPAAAAAAGWLDVAVTDGLAAVRIAARDGRGKAEEGPAEGAAVPGDARPGDARPGDAGWLVDSIAAARLWQARWSPRPEPGSPATQQQVRLAAMAEALRETGLGTARPPAWADSLAAEPGSPGGGEAARPAVAVLPSLDGAQLSVAGIVTAAASVTVFALVWGVAPAAAAELTTERYLWLARDDLGHWHAGRALGGPRRPVVALDVVLVPALDPAATTLEVIVTGRGGRVQATVDL